MNQTEKARRFAELHGLTPSVVTGFGASLPVASNDTDEGRQKNRRMLAQYFGVKTNRLRVIFDAQRIVRADVADLRLAFSRIFEESQGYPFFVEELYRHLIEEGRVFDAAGQFRRDIRIDEIGVPDNVRLIISRRSRSLYPPPMRLRFAPLQVVALAALDIVESVKRFSDSA